MRKSYSERLVAVGGELGDLREHETVWIPGYGFAQTGRPSAKYHLTGVDVAGNDRGLCGVTGVSIVARVLRTDVLEMFGCRQCLKTLEASVLTMAGVSTANVTTSVTVGDSAHAWADVGEPLRNSDPNAASIPMLDCPKCGDVILDVVDLRSGPLSVPKNIHSTLGRVWYARCPACAWTSRECPNEWVLLEAVTEART